MSDYDLVLDACRRGNLTDAELGLLRKLSLKVRGDLIVTLCREAAIAEANRIKAGLPPTEREPWHESTLEWMRKWTAQSLAAAQRKLSSSEEINDEQLTADDADASGCH